MKKVKAIRLTNSAAIDLVDRIQRATKEATASGVAERLMFLGATIDPVLRHLVPSQESTSNQAESYATGTR
jgi:hypothetical protein